MNKIVVIEDDETLRENTLTFLQEEGFEAYAANDGPAGLLLVKEILPDLVLCDIGLPKMNGYDTCIAMRKIDNSKDIPLIFITAYGNPDSIVKGFAAGAQDYVTKPYNYMELLARINTHIDLKHKKEQLLQANYRLEEKIKELHRLNSEIAAQRNEMEVQRDIVTKQKVKIEEIYSTLSDSIIQAEKIQNAILPSDEYIGNLWNTENLSDSNYIPQNSNNFFILYKPFNIVSGDFYWFMKLNNWVLIAVADCTGHGVSGAFMSMLGISFLNEIVARKEVTSASQVLDELRQRVIITLKQTGQSIMAEPKDGMDIAFVALNADNLELQYAGANIPLYIVATCHASIRPDTSVETNAPNIKPTLIEVKADMPAVTRLIEVKADKMPISIYYSMKPFANHTVKLNKNDQVYLSTDGFPDQFGGPSGTKFLRKNFRNILADIGTKPLYEQNIILSNTLENWMKGFGTSYEQTDDITVMGIKI